MSFQHGFVGTIPPQEFLETFMKPATALMPAPHIDFSRLYSCETNEDAREILIHILDDSQLCPSLKFYLPKLKKRQAEILRAEIEEDMAEDERELHISCHPAVAARKQKLARRKSTRKDLYEYYSFSNTVLALDTAVRQDEDPFVDCKVSDIATTSVSPLHPAGSTNGEGVFDIATVEGHIARARLLTSAQALFSRQHRSRLFELLFVSKGVRFVLFDQSGAIVSQRFDYLKTPDTLADFFWRFSHMNDAARGMDPAAVLATQQEARLFTEAIHDFVSACQVPGNSEERRRSLPNAEHSLDSSNTYPVWAIQVSGSVTGTSTKLVTQKPFAGHATLFSRGTRAYLAYDVNEQQLVFLKDSWRASSSHTRPEFDIYQDLQSGGVPFVPDVMYGGDVLDPDGRPQRTVVDVVLARNASWSLTDTQLHGKIHHRIVQEIFYPLDFVSDERELIQVIHDAILAIDKTYQTLGVLHRDISSANVMLDARGQCVLSDWDHAGPPDPDEGAMGTTQFMSVRLLHDDSAYNELVDDLQSAFWVLNFVAIVRFAQHHNNLARGLFEGCGPEPSNRTALATAKFLGMCGSLYEDRYRSAPLTALIRDLAESWTRFEEQQIVPPKTGTGEEAEPNMLELAPQPQYWLEKFAKALRECDAEKEAARSALEATEAAAAAETPEEPHVARAGTKRKAAEDVPADDERCLVRRSKRLRAQRQRKL
ncbi:hypothetical protein PsYK624_082260 [Phanerochaete sordida]|uniref:Fungal-type protein kinase domain-containing protein n=1 Tax=Phanerochaete sordida TaxID=48140 RepID=A0A9P3G9W5_9APHY|nr:hypothetical protein PsYK624_082260 [Phanerochaete sordida]